MNTETTNEFANKVINIIADFKNIPPEQIGLETTLAELGMDSLDGLNLIFELEEAFNVTVPDENTLQMKTVREIVSGMEKLITHEQVAA